MTHDVYGLYSPDDGRVANVIGTALEQDDIRCWIAPRDLVPGIAFVQSIAEAISTARLTLLVLTDSANNSHQVAREIEHSRSHGVPVLLSGRGTSWRPPPSSSAFPRGSGSTP